MKKREISRIYLSSYRRKKTKKFLNIVALYKEGKLLEFKFTFEGLPKEGFWSLVKDTVVDSTAGVLKSGNTYKLEKGIEIGYHADGNIMYKSGTNFKPKKNLAFDKLTEKPNKFMTILGFTLSSLIPETNEKKENKAVLELDYSSHDKISCIFFISKGKNNYNFEPDKVKSFTKPSTINLHDDSSDTSFHLFFHSTDSSHLGVIIEQERTFFRRIYYYILSHFYSLKK